MNNFSREVHKKTNLHIPTGGSQRKVTICMIFGANNSSFEKSDDQTAGDDERAANVDGKCGGLAEADLIEELSNDEEEDDVKAEESAEVPTREVDEGAIGGEDEYAGGDGAEAGPA